MGAPHLRDRRWIGRLGVWACITTVVVISARAIVYALAPQSVLLEALARQEAGPHVAGALAGAVLAAAVIALAVLWLAALAVRERLELEGRRLVEQPRLRPGLLALRAAGLFATASFAFAMTESYIHWRAGLGWHGLHCLLGPVHRDAVPLLFALSLIAVALHGAVEHLLAWAGRLFARLAARLPVLRRPAKPVLFVRHRRRRSLRSVAGARGPPGGLLVPVPAL